MLFYKEKTMATLQEIRAKLIATEQRNAENKNKFTVDNTIYQFWNLEENAESTIRFLPDKDENNIFFWVERQIIRLPFPGIMGNTESKPVTVQVPCMEMFGGTCPILAEVRPWFKDPSLEEMGRKYWKKRSYIAQGFVTVNGLDEESVPENPIRRFIIGPQIYQIIRATLVDPELEYTPTDYVHGLDFRLKKTSKGKHADYNTSTWARKERPLSEYELSAVEQYGLFNLKDFLPKKPTDVELNAIKEMFAASVNEEPYDVERWGQYYKPFGIGDETTEPVSTPAINASTLTKEPAQAKSEPTNSRADAILNMIKNRQKA